MNGEPPAAPPDAHLEPSAGDRESKDDEAIRALLKRAADEAPPGEGDGPPPKLLSGVQKRLRTRSKGKFFADGWSTSPSRINYGFVAVAMLIVIAVAYFALGPTGITAH